MKTHISQFALKQATRGERRTKNVQIEFWRFAFAIYMIVYHTLGHVYGIKTGGYIGVDIFFMISGYFLAASHEKKRNRTGDNSLTEMGAYFKDRFIRLWPMYLCAYFLKVILWGIQEQQSIRKIIERIYRSFPEMFMLRINPSINGVSWFTCAMLLGALCCGRFCPWTGIASCAVAYCLFVRSSFIVGLSRLQGEFIR